MTEGVEWAAHCAVVLALLPAEARLSASQLAQYHDVPGPYLAKALQALKRAGIVSSSPGRQGGYRLARPADQISLLDLVQAVEGDAPAFRCTEIRRRGPCRAPAASYRATCSIAAAMWRAEAAWKEELSRCSVGDMVARVVSEAPPEVIKKAADWMSKAVAI